MNLWHLLFGSPRHRRDRVGVLHAGTELSTRIAPGGYVGAAGGYHTPPPAASLPSDVVRVDRLLVGDRLYSYGRVLGLRGRLDGRVAVAFTDTVRVFDSDYLVLVEERPS